jgi:hypothetical protein
MAHAAKSQRIFDHIIAIRAFYCLADLVSIFSHLNLPPDKAISLTSSRALLRKPTEPGGRRWKSNHAAITNYLIMLHIREQMIFLHLTISFKALPLVRERCGDNWSVQHRWSAAMMGYFEPGMVDFWKDELSRSRHLAEISRSLKQLCGSHSRHVVCNDIEYEASHVL